MKNRLMTEQITEIALLLSMALVIEIIFKALPSQPQGGSISVSLLPLVVIAWRHGVKVGLFGGVVFSMLNLLLNPVIYHWASLFLDYIFAFGAVGFAAYFAKINRQSPLFFGLALLYAGVVRFLFHLVSGAVLFGEFAPEGQNVWVYSFTYNITYMGPTTALILVVGIPVFLKLKDKFNDLETE